MQQPMDCLPASLYVFLIALTAGIATEEWNFVCRLKVKIVLNKINQNLININQEKKPPAEWFFLEPSTVFYFFCNVIIFSSEIIIKIVCQY